MKKEKICLCWVFVACECPYKNVSNKCNYLCSKFSSNHICMWQCTIFCLVNFAFCNCQSLHGVMTLKKYKIHSLTLQSMNEVSTHISLPISHPPPPQTPASFVSVHCITFTVILIYTLRAMHLCFIKAGRGSEGILSQNILRPSHHVTCIMSHFLI